MGTMSVSDYQGKITVSGTSIVWYWRVVEMVALGIMFLLSHTNPIFKIAMALHIGLQMMAFLVYSVIVYYKTAQMGSKDTTDASRGGFFKTISTFLPQLMTKISYVLLQFVVIKILRIPQNVLKPKSIKYLSCVVTFLIIGFRKLTILAATSYITREDDEPTYVKSVFIFTIFVVLQLEFIQNLDSNWKETGRSRSDSLLSGFKMLTTLKNVKNTLLLKSVRRQILFISRLVFALTVYTIVHIAETSYVWNLLIKGSIFLDALVINSLTVEIVDMNFTFCDKKDTLV